MRDKIRAAAAQHKRIEAKRGALVDDAGALLTELNEAFGDAPISGRSSIVTLEQIGLDDYVYGYLDYRDFELAVAYRTTEEDLADAHLSDEERSYSFRHFSTVPRKWLESLMTEDGPTSLIQNITDRLDVQEGRVDRARAALQAIVAAESAEIEAQTTASMAALNSDAVAKNWQDALDASHVDTADALTRATRMLESVCAAILMERGVSLPKDKSLSPLLKACIDNLGLPDLPELQPDLKQLLGGIASICGGAAALRTHFGTAHGATSHFAPLDAAFGVLAKNTCAAAAIFLIDRHKNGGSAS
ncbi:hypothetical protein DIE14_02300 [Burkholderia sp. Bp9017]|uniref:abortive infection family protein n=1 Tax=unclassified Burkholderia TaxID=2613784 RepID=UPI000F5EE057|nr:MULTISPECIES: abortive infection family protein [unclassified Burkholderia]RQZ31757.1 hypothetical protein DIE14_02300 [Burkholderia sp. Bp9017]RQZ37889.1 hypothetical protein DIE13_02290 [Burkholderia sp. Bp9016]